MAKDVADVLGTAIGRAAREAAKNVSASARKRSSGGNLVERMTGSVSDRMDGAFSGSKGLAAGAAVATLVPLAAKGASKLVRGMGGGDGEGPMQKVGDKVSGTVKNAVSDQVDKAGGAGGIAKEAGKSILPGIGGGDDDDKEQKSKGVPGVGKGRRMPFQWDIDIGVPVSTVYEHWTNFDEWPKFMHRLQSVSQEDDEHVKFKAKIWGISREFTAEIVEQTPEERIKWKVTEGLTHQGVVTFHELAPRLTRVEVSFDVEPGGMIEKAARGMRHVKRAARADLARFKAYVLMQEQDDDESSDEGDEEEAQGRESSSRSGSQPSSGGESESSSGGDSESSSSGDSESSGRSRSSNGRSRSSSSSGRKSSSGRGRSSSSSGSSSGGRSRSSSSRSPSATKRSSSSRGSGSSSGRKSSSSSGSGSSSGRKSSSSSGSGSSSGRKRSSSSSGRKQSSSGGRKQSSPSARKRSSTSSNGRSSSSRTTSSGNGRSSSSRSSSSNGRSSKKRTGTRS